MIKAETALEMYIPIYSANEWKLVTIHTICGYACWQMITDHAQFNDKKLKALHWTEFLRVNGNELR